MNHQEAVSAGAVERYLLRQLSDTEADEFEQHFFDCLECTRGLQAGALLEDNAQAIFLEERASETPKLFAVRRPAAGKRSVWAAFFAPSFAAPALAGLALALIAAYQTFIVIPRLRARVDAALAPQAVASYVLPPLSRGGARVLDVPAGAEFYAIYMDPAWDGSFAAYECSVDDESGATRFHLRLAAPPPGKPLQILLSRSLLGSGRYTVVIRNAAESGKPQTELARYALILKFE